MIIDEFKFFRRQEIKDVMAYFKLLMNPNDSVSAKRIIKRYVAGIGDARIAAIESPETRQVGLKLTDFMDMPIFEAEPYAKLVSGLENHEVVVYDVESTGTDTSQDRIIQIAAIRIDENGQVLETFERFINPGVPVGQSEEVHGFSDAYLQEHGEEPVIVLQAFKEFSKNAIIVGHNVNYDVTIFTNELARHNLGNPEFKAIYDTLDIYRRFYPNLPNHKLGFLASEFPINHEPTHNAMDDILATAQLLIYAVKENIVPTTTGRMVAINKYKAALIDRRAMEYILARHPADGIQFIDGWTGKGMITRTLRSALEQFPLYEYGIGRDKLDRLCEIAVLADPAGLCRLCGTHGDMFIPCACLNSVVSGLFSRTVLKTGVIQPDEFHGAAYFGELAPLDRTYEFITAIEAAMTYGEAQLPPPASGNGLAETREIAEKFGVPDIKLVKPGIGETTRVLLRRIPELILLRDPDSPLTRHISELAREKGVEVRQYPLKCYEACGIIRVMDNV